MVVLDSVEVPLAGLKGRTGCRLLVTALPRNGKSAAPRGDVPTATGVSALSLLEGQEYRYQWLGVDESVGPLEVDPAEVFQPDALDGRAGRLRTGLSTGFVQVVLRSAGRSLGHVEIEVRSRKLHYESEYRWMLRDIADRMTELVMDRFAVSQARFKTDDCRDARTLYQRFSFLRALFQGEVFQAALLEVLRRPHTAWAQEQEAVPPGHGVRGGSQLVRQLSHGGPRTAWLGGPLSTLPASLQRERTEATHDTTPNRFVRYALKQWQAVLGDIDSRLAQLPPAPFVDRGRREVAVVSVQMEEMLHHSLFDEVGELTRFPADDQVLQKREGYRDIFRAYLEFELASRLSWQSSVDTFDAGQRDVAALYEYWAFLQLAQAVADLVGQSFDLAPLVKMSGDGLNIGLRTGTGTVLSGETVRHGRRLAIELWFNRTYRLGSESAASWTRPMRPDFSLHISPGSGEAAGFESIILHFDAKYRVDFASELFGSGDEVVGDTYETRSDADAQPIRGGALRADLLKMHSYRDAIRRSAGAYVLYPGGDDEVNAAQFAEYHELLPGLGAFVLRPAEYGQATGLQSVRRFLEEVLCHVATRLSEHERSRRWHWEVYGGKAASSAPVLMDLPPETPLLLVRIPDQDHWDWLDQRQSLMLQAANRSDLKIPTALLRTQLLLLHCPAGMLRLARIVSAAEWVAADAARASGYPSAHSDFWSVLVNWADLQVDLSGVSLGALDRLSSSAVVPQLLAWGDVQLAR